uniref:Uncharacterized protein n=1 Tax=Oryza brachyantha TaxID=4533 RepID=J3N7H3_ORYBR
MRKYYEKMLDETFVAVQEDSDVEFEDNEEEDNDKSIPRVLKNLTMRTRSYG